MGMQQLIELCQWDFTSYSDVLALSPYQSEIIRYRKRLTPLNKRDLFSNELIQTKDCLIKIVTEPFGFYSWMPSCESDRLLVLEHKAKPKPWTNYKPSDPDQELIAGSTISILEDLMSEAGFLTGISCIGGQASFPLDYQIMFARSSKNPLPIYVDFSLSMNDVMLKNAKQWIAHLVPVAQDILHKRKEALKKELG